MRDHKITSKERLEHIADAIKAIESFLEGQTKESFLNNVVLINATLFQFSIIGKAIVHVDHELLDRNPFPWYKVRAFRNFIVHEYHAIEFRLVWDTAKDNLPQLKQMINQILKNEF